MTDRRAIQYAAGSLAASAFVAVTQILAGAKLDLPLDIALAAFAANIPLQVILFFMPVAVPRTPVMSWPQIIYWAIHRYSTIATLIGFVALFWHFACWLAVLSAISSFVAYRVYCYCATAPDYDTSEKPSGDAPSTV